jgi:hypothetical protein
MQVRLMSCVSVGVLGVGVGVAAVGMVLALSPAPRSVTPEELLLFGRALAQVGAVFALPALAVLVTRLIPPRRSVSPTAPAASS